MPSQGVTIAVQDNGLGQQPLGLGNILWVIGCSSIGTALQPLQTASPSAITATFGYGPGPEFCCNAIAATGNPVVFVKVASAVAGTNTGVTSASGNTSTSAVTLTGAPQDTYYGKLTVVTGGTIGTAGIQVQVSLDYGRTIFLVSNLGTATTLAITNVNGVTTGLTINFAAGTLVTGDTFTWISDEPQWLQADVSSAVQKLYSWTQSTPKDIIVVGGPQKRNGVGTVGCKGADATSIDGYMTSLFTKNRFMRAICGAGDALWGGLSTESESTWQTSVVNDYAAVSSLRVGACAGHYNCVSAISATQFRRSLLWFAGVRDAAVAIQVDLGRVKDGALGNLVLPSSPDGFIYHDESVNPGFDAARLMSAWSLVGRPGLFIKNPNLLAPPGSDFNWLQHGAVIDAASLIAYDYWIQELSDSVRVYASGTNAGQILQQDLQTLIAGSNNALAVGLVNPGAASAATTIIPPGQNVLSSAQLAVTIAVTPLGYLKSIPVTLMFVNPAIQAVGGA